MQQTLPASPNLDHLKKQAKHLLRDARAGESAALQRFIDTLPAARGLDLAALVQRDLNLSDAQSVTAREYGFKSWAELTRFVEWTCADRTERLKTWLKWAYEGDARERRLAVRMVRDEPGFFAGDLTLACALGDEATVHRFLAADPSCVNRPGSSLHMPPLVAVTHSRLILESGFEPGLLACAALLIQHGADVSATRIHPDFPDCPLSALYGAAGRNHHPAMTRLLLDAGASPNDNESLYHSVESLDPTCTHLLLAAGAGVAGTNALARSLDYDRLEILELLLAHAKAESADGPIIRHEIHHAILRGRSTAHVLALVHAGADLRATNRDGLSLLRYAWLHGRADVVEILRQAGITDSDDPLTGEEQFIAACAQADEVAVHAILQRHPDILTRLTEKQLQTMPELAATGQLRPVQTMLAAGWPREIKFGWGATALNLAVFCGDAEMASLLLENGADWRTTHNYGDNVLGTLSYASTAEIAEGPGDFVGCARALVSHGVPLSSFEGHYFSPGVSRYLDTIRLKNEHPAE